MHAIEIKNLEKTYHSGQRALNGVDLTIERGDFFALLGPNGAGKSTTIGIICGLVNKSKGLVKVFEHDIDVESDAAKAALGIVPQEINFSQFESCLEIVVNQGGYYGVPRKLASKRAEKYLSQLGLWEKRNICSRELSGGLKRRLMIARALIHEPEILILDEPTAGVDVELRRSMWDFLIETNRRGTTILLTTHYLEEAERLCKNIAIIDEGSIIKNTSLKGLLHTLNKETFVLDLAEPFEFIPKVNGYELILVDKSTVEVEVEQKKNINDLFVELNKHNISVRSIRSKSNRLEELFLALVDHK